MNTKTIVKYAMVLVCTLFSVMVNAATGITTLVSVSSDGVPANQESGSSRVSADGRFVAFSSYADNLVAEDTKEHNDIFIHDRQTSETSRVSVASDGAQGNNWSSSLCISADGRYVAFSSLASNLVAEDTNYTWDVFVHDRQTGETTRISVASDGAQANGFSESPSISADGRFVAFDSFADNLVAKDTNNTDDIFIHDRQTSETIRISMATDGTQGNSWSENASISTDGRFITFNSHADNLIAKDTNNTDDIFVHDRQTSETTRISVTSDGVQGNAWSGSPSISANGRFIAFSSLASNLVVGDTNSEGDIFIHDRQTGETTRVSMASDGTQANSDSFSPSISADGNFIAFASDKNPMGHPKKDIFVYNRQTGETIRVNETTDGARETNGYLLDSPSISADGRVVAFVSDATNLLEGIIGDKARVYAHERLVGPLAEPQVVNLPVNTPTPLILRGRDPENNPLTFNIITPPVYGVLNGTAPELVYEPNTKFFVVDRFTFTVSDGVETSAPVAVILRVPSTNAQCSKLGNYPNKTQLDRDSFYFKGIGDEDVTIKLEKDLDGISTGNRVYMVLWQVKDRKIVIPRLVYKQGRMPIELKTTLPGTGNYLINVVERRGAPFIGDYCLSMNASEGSADTLRATRSVE